MFTRSYQISSPLLLPLLGTIVSTGVIASIFLVPSPRTTFSPQQLFVTAALDLVIAACIHLATVWAIWRVIREYLQPPVGLLMLHIWAAVVWLPLVALLDAERSLWICCIVPWAFVNAGIYLKLWSASPAGEEAEHGERQTTRPLFQMAPMPPLWRMLLPYVIAVLALQGGAALLANGKAWMSAALFSICLLTLLLRHPFARPSVIRRRFSTSSFLQTTMAFFLLAMALTPFLQKAYAAQGFRSLLAIRTPPAAPPRLPAQKASGYSGVVLVMPPVPHPRVEPPTPGDRNPFSMAIRKPVVIPFDGVYWYFKQPEIRPGPDARIQRGDPIRANVRSTDNVPLMMEAHQDLPNPIAMECCRGLRVDLLNGDVRPGVIRMEVRLKDKSRKAQAAVSLGTVAIPSSQLQHIPLNRPPVQESLRFQLPIGARGKRFDEITLIIKPASDRSLAGSKIAIKNFTLLP